MDAKEKAALLREWQLRQGDPLRAAYKSLTGAQRSYVDATQLSKLIQGGNRSGKTWTATVCFLMQALGIHPTLDNILKTNWSAWEGWWVTVTYNLFALQTWDHFKRLLLFPGESVHKLPTRRILQIGWQKKSPETPDYVLLRREDGKFAKIYIKSVDQGRGAFQSAGPNRAHADEEIPIEIREELQPRTWDRNAILSDSATPISGAKYLAEIEEKAKRKEPGIFFVRIDTRDNPSLSVDALNQYAKEYENDPETLRLRLQGFPRASEGLVYKDHLFTADHVCEPFDISATWTRYRSIDHGYRHFVCLWFAVSPSEDDIVLYREYHGQEKSIIENARAVVDFTGAELITNTVIDRATTQHNGAMNEDGHAVRTIDLYRAAGVPCFESPEHTVWAGIAKVWALLAQVGGDTAKRRFRVFKTCEYFLDERRNYRNQQVGDAGSDRPEKHDNPLKKKDHAMDAWRYRIVGGMPYREPGAGGPPPEGTLGRVLFDRRMPKRVSKL